MDVDQVFIDLIVRKELPILHYIVRILAVMTHTNVKRDNRKRSRSVSTMSRKSPVEKAEKSDKPKSRTGVRRKPVNWTDTKNMWLLLAVLRQIQSPNICFETVSKDMGSEEFGPAQCR